MLRTGGHPGNCWYIRLGMNCWGLHLIFIALFILICIFPYFNLRAEQNDRFYFDKGEHKGYFQLLYLLPIWKERCVMGGYMIDTVCTGVKQTDL